MSLFERQNEDGQNEGSLYVIIIASKTYAHAHTCMCALTHMTDKQPGQTTSQAN